MHKVVIVKRNLQSRKEKIDTFNLKKIEKIIAKHH